MNGDAALRERNFEASLANLPQVHEILVNYQPASTLIWGDDGDANLVAGETRIYDPGARKIARQQLDEFSAAPDRMMLTRPEPGQFDVYAERFFLSLTARLAEQSIGVGDGDGFADTECYFLLLFGVGLGFHIDESISRTNCRSLIIVEEDMEFLFHSLETYDWTAFFDRMRRENRRINFVFHHSPEQIAGSILSTIRFSNPCAFDGLTMFVHRTSPALTSSAEMFKTETAATIGNLGHFYDEVLMLKNAFVNLHGGNKRIYRHPKERRLGVPAFVVGTGPSLDNDLQFLRENQEKAVIVSSGSALRPILKNGIVPDFHVETENIRVTQIVNQVANDFDLSSIVLVAATTVDPRVCRFFEKTFYFIAQSSQSIPY